MGLDSTEQQSSSFLPTLSRVPSLSSVLVCPPLPVPVPFPVPPSSAAPPPPPPPPPHPVSSDMSGLNRRSSGKLDDWKKMKAAPLSAQLQQQQQHILNPNPPKKPAPSNVNAAPNDPLKDDYHYFSQLKRSEQLSSNNILREIAAMRRSPAAPSSVAHNSLLNPSYRVKATNDATVRGARSQRSSVNKDFSLWNEDDNMRRKSPPQPFLPTAPSTARAEASSFTRPDSSVPNSSFAAAAERVERRQDYVPMRKGTVEPDVKGANERVEKRFQYWKQFWSNIQALRAKNPSASIPLPDLEGFSVTPAAPAGFGMDPRAFQMDDEKAMEMEMEQEYFMDKNNYDQRGTDDAAIASAAASAAQAHAHFQQYQLEFANRFNHNPQYAQATQDPTAASSPFKQPAASPASSFTTSPTKSPHRAAPSLSTRSPDDKTRDSNNNASNNAQYNAAAAAAAADSSTNADNKQPRDDESHMTQEQKDEAERKRSNVERFWQEEMARKGKPRVHNQKKKKTTQFQAPPDPEAAKALWEKMAADLDSKWSKFSTSDNKPSQSPNSHPSYQPNIPPSSNLQSDSSSGNYRPPSASVSNSNDKRSGAYAFTNVGKEDIRVGGGHGSNLKYNPAPAPPPSNPGLHVPSSGYFNVKPSVNMPNQASGAQFSSFSRPPQPHHAQPTTSSTFTTSTTTTTSHTTSNNSSTSYSSYSSSSTSTSTNAPPPSAHGVTNPTQLREIYLRWNVRDLKKELVYYGVSSFEIDKLVEKEEFVVKMIQVHIESERKKEAKRQQEIKEKETENLKDKIIQEVERWAKGRSIKSMLNELNGLQSPDQPGFLKRTDMFKEVNKSYKKALLRIHPDKHMDSESKHLRATEVFKYVSQAFTEYRKKYEK